MKRSFFFFYTALIIIILNSCEGPEGKVGPNGLNSLIKTTEEPIGTNCKLGGLKLETGLDNNVDGTLDPNEVLKTDYVCSIPGNNSLVNTEDEPSGVNCENGGLKIDSGIDNNNNGILDNNEIQVTRFVCNGIDGGFDEQIRLTIVDHGSSNIGTISTTGELFGELIKFDISNFISVDSVIFVSEIRTNNSENFGYAELYNNTDSEIISNTTLSTNNTNYQILQSGNIINDLPSKEVSLSVQMRVEDSATALFLTSKSYIILYRKK